MFISRFRIGDFEEKGGKEKMLSLENNADFGKEMETDLGYRGPIGKNYHF